MEVSRVFGVGVGGQVVNTWFLGLIMDLVLKA